MPPRLIDPFHRRLYGILAQELDDLRTAVAKGAAGSYEEYKVQVAKIETLEQVLTVCQDIETQTYSGVKEETSMLSS